MKPTQHIGRLFELTAKISVEEEQDAFGRARWQTRKEVHPPR